jgi:hypothetical protein
MLSALIEEHTFFGGALVQQGHLFQQGYTFGGVSIQEGWLINAGV